MINTVTGVIFARLILVFTAIVSNITYPVALIHPYDAPIRSQPRKDKDLGFLRVRSKLRSAAEFVSPRAIIRGVPLAPVFDKKGDFLVMDSIDADLFLRVLKLLNM